MLMPISSTGEQALSGQLASGDFSAEVPDAGSHAGTAIQYGDADDNIRYRTLSTRRQTDSHNVHFVQTIEGQPALIQAGQDIPLAKSLDRGGTLWHLCGRFH